MKSTKNRIIEKIKESEESEESEMSTLTLTFFVSRLPDVCQNIIYRHLHMMYMVDLKREIIYNVVWVRLRSGNNYRYEFLTSTQKNYVVWEEDEND